MLFIKILTITKGCKMSKEYINNPWVEKAKPKTKDKELDQAYFDKETNESPLFSNYNAFLWRSAFNSAQEKKENSNER
jgi:hypothetical protein